MKTACETVVLWVSEEAEGPFTAAEMAADALGEHLVSTKVAGRDVGGEPNGEPLGHEIIEVTARGLDVEAATSMLRDAPLRVWTMRATFWQRSSAARVRRRITPMENSPQLEVGDAVETEVLTVVPHPTFAGMVRIDVYGAPPEGVFHLLDDRPLWDDEPTSPCACKRGCSKCCRTRIQPPPSFGYAGCGGP